VEAEEDLGACHPEERSINTPVIPEERSINTPVILRSAATKDLLLPMSLEGSAVVNSYPLTPTLSRGERGKRRT
jgi:hypothetical protein